MEKEELIAIVTREHLQVMLEKVRSISPILRGSIERGDITLISGIYDTETGRVILIGE